MVIPGCIRKPPLKITLKSGSRRIVQRHDAAFEEFCPANHKAVWRDVIESQSNGF
jgi:hypothetical protein